ncbi:MAG: universal stress protein [Halobacteriaceae archaeon]
MYEHILVPTDGSEGSERAVAEAIGLAQTFGATIHAVYVVDAASIPSGIDASMTYDALEEYGEEVLEDVAERAREADVEVETEVVSGSPHAAIVDYAESHDVDLVVMGTHGRRGLDRYLLGSVTEKVVRTSPAPVLTVRLSPGEASD